MTKDNVLETWHVLQLRTTVFPDPTNYRPNKTWWDMIMNSEPDKVTNNPKLGLLTIEGDFQPGKAVLEFQPVRTDLVVMQPQYDDFSNISQIPSLGPLGSLLEKFLDVSMKLLSLDYCPDALRIAFGAHVVIPTKSHAESYQKLAEKLNTLNLNFEGNPQDFMYQINRPRMSETGISNLKINRIAKWS